MPPRSSRRPRGSAAPAPCRSRPTRSGRSGTSGVLPRRAVRRRRRRKRRGRGSSAARSRRRARASAASPLPGSGCAASVGTTPELGPRIERGELDLQPELELALLGPDPGHLGSRVARDHWAKSSCRPGRLRASKSAHNRHTPVRIPPPKSVLSPGGWGLGMGPVLPPAREPAVRRRGSALPGRRRSSRCRRRRRRPGHPAASARSRAARRGRRARSSTSEAARRSPAGRCARRRLPASAAARPAPAISTRSPRSRAERAYSATASGWRWAERTSSSQAMSRAASSSSAGCMRSRSDSEPIRMPTRGALRHAADVATISRAGERDQLRPPRRLRRARVRKRRRRRR